MINISFKPGALEKVMKANARNRAGWERLEELADKYDKEGNRVLDVGIHGDIWPGGHKYMFDKATYETADIDGSVNPTHTVDIRDMTEYFPEPTFDMIICHSVIEHILENRKEAYKELYRILKPGGTLIYFWPSTLERESEPSSYVSPREIRDSYEQTDCTMEKLEDGNYKLEVFK